MRKQIALGALMAMGFAGSALAADGFSYNLLEGGYSYADIKNTSIHGDEFWVGGSVAFGDSFYGFGHVSTVDYSGFTATGFSLGVGFHAAISSSVDFVSGLSLETFDPEGGSSESGYGLSVGLRGHATDKLELDGGVQYADYGHGDNGLVFSVGSRYYFTEMFAAGLDISIDDESDSTAFGITFRYDFGG